MRKNRNNYQLSRKELNKRLEDMTCKNFRLLSEKKALIDMKEELELIELNAEISWHRDAVAKIGWTD